MVAIRVSPWLTSTGANVAIGLMGVVTSIILSRNLGPSGRGVLTEAMLWPNLILLIGGIVNTQTVVYFWAKGQRSQSTGKTLGSNLVLSLLLVILLVPICLGVNWFLLGRFGKESYGLANLYSLVIPVTLALFCFHPVFLAVKQFGVYWGSRVFYSALYLFGLLFLATIHRVSPRLVVIIILLALCVQTVCTVVAFSNRFRLTASWDQPMAKDMLSYGIRMNLSALPNYLNMRLDQMIMSVMLPPEILGWYASAFAWSSILSMLGVGISTVMLTRSASLDASDEETVSNLLRSLRLALICLVALAVGAVIITPIGIPLVFGSTFAPAIVPAVILCVASVFSNFNAICHEVIRGLGAPQSGIRAEFVGLASNISLLMLLLPSYAGIGAAISSLVSYAIVSIVLVNALSKQISRTTRECVVPSMPDIVELRTKLISLVGYAGRVPPRKRAPYDAGGPGRTPS